MRWAQSPRKNADLLETSKYSGELCCLKSWAIQPRKVWNGENLVLQTKNKHHIRESRYISSNHPQTAVRELLRRLRPLLVSILPLIWSARGAGIFEGTQVKGLNWAGMAPGEPEKSVEFQEEVLGGGIGRCLFTSPMNKIE